MSALPAPYVALVLALGVYRITRLLGWDEFPPIARWRDRLLDKRPTRQLTNDQSVPAFVFGRPTLAAGWQCPYCLGFWVGLLVWLLWLAVPDFTVYLMAPFALNAVVGIVARNLD